MSKRDGLIVVRCGDASLHREWLSSSLEWDLAVSYFGKDDDAAFPEATYVHRYRGGKWDGIFDFFSRNPECLDKYEYFWLPDDDISATPADLNRLLAYMRTEQFELAQPSLRAGSYVSHLTTLHSPFYEFRNVNFVELMVPTLSAKMLKTVLPLFRTAKTGFGIDFVWQRFTSDPRTRVAIIDAVQVVHTRPVGGALHKMIAETGATPAVVERDLFLKNYGPVHKDVMTFGGRTTTGRTITQRHVATTLAAAGWFSRLHGNRGFRGPIGPMRFAWWVIRHWRSGLFRPVQWDRLEPVHKC
jgi:hypothetical protein